MNRKKVNNAIKELKSTKLLDEKITTKLELQEAKRPMFHQFQKIHKPENLWRRLISSVICNTTSTSQYLDKYLQPCVKDLQSYIKDSTDLMKKNNNPEKIPENSILVTMGVRSLDTNIPHKESIKAVETASKRENKQTRVIITFLKLIPTLSNS